MASLERGIADSPADDATPGAQPLTQRQSWITPSGHSISVIYSSDSLIARVVDDATGNYLLLKPGDNSSCVGYCIYGADGEFLRGGDAAGTWSERRKTMRRAAP